jgi:hypothetical protein
VLVFSEVASFLTRLFLAAALVLTGTGALLHPLEHVDAQGGLVHVPGKNETADTLCDVLAALTAVASGRVQHASVPVSTYFLPAFSAGELRISGAPPFLAQGPPTLL